MSDATSDVIRHASGNSPSPLFPCSLPPRPILYLTSRGAAFGDWSWIMNPNEISRLAHATNDLRPDWPISSLTTFITRQLAGRTYRDAAVALAWIATDTKLDGTHATDTPKRVLEAGPWWRAATIENPGSLRPHPPKREGQCRRCGGELPSCACTREHLAAPDDEPADLAPLPVAATPAEAARALLARTRAARCGCGVDRLTCPQHRPAAATEETADE